MSSDPTKSWPPTTPNGMTVTSVDSFPTNDPNAAPGEGLGITTRRLDSSGMPGQEGVLSAQPDADGWYVGHIPGYRQQIGVRETSADGQSWWEARVDSTPRPHRYLNRVTAQQGALAELQRLKIAGET
jgi:hypothetical protein